MYNVMSFLLKTMSQSAAQGLQSAAQNRHIRSRVVWRGWYSGREHVALVTIVKHCHGHRKN